MIPHAIFFAGMLLAALLFALAEIQIEGADGWAASLPTWRVDNKWTRFFLGRRPLTGYHLYAQTFMLAFAHLPFILGMAAVSLKGEFRILSFLLFFWIAEDFLWFVLNPAFGIRKFSREHAVWHAPAWWWIMPRDYWIFIPAAAALYYFSL